MFLSFPVMAYVKDKDEVVPGLNSGKYDRIHFFSLDALVTDTLTPVASCFAFLISWMIFVSLIFLFEVII